MEKDEIIEQYKKESNERIGDILFEILQKNEIGIEREEGLEADFFDALLNDNMIEVSQYDLGRIEGLADGHQDAFKETNSYGDIVSIIASHTI